MLLNPSILYEELLKEYPSIEFSGSSRLSRYLAPPLLFQSDMKTDSNTIYVGESRSFTPDCSFPENCCIVSIGELSDPNLFLWTPKIIIKDDVSLLCVYNSIQQIYRKLSAWNDEVNRLVLNDAEIQSILDVSRPLFPNTFLLVLDQDYNVLATTAEASIVMDETGSTPVSVLNRFRKDPEYVSTRFKKGTFLYKGKYFDHKILLHHLFVHNEMRGTFSMAEHGGVFTTGIRSLFEHLAEYIDCCFAHRAYAMTRLSSRPNTVFQDLLSGRMPLSQSFADALSFLHWSPEDSYRICFIAIHEADRLIGSTLYLCRQLESRFISAFSLEFNGDIIIILNISKIGEKEALSKKALADFLDQNSLSCGISMGFSDLLQIKNYYIQAKSAYSIGSKKGGGPLYHFQDLTIEYMISKISSEMDPEALCPEALLKLLENDKEKGTQNILTLRTYFETGMNASLTAKLLYINRSTLLERLNKLWSVLNLDPANHNDRLYLTLCIHILES